MKNFEKNYDKNYKKLLILPGILLVLSLIYLGFFFAQTGSLINRDVSLTGGTTITVFSDFNVEVLEKELSNAISDFEIRTLSDNTGRQKEIIVIVKEDQRGVTEETIERTLEIELNLDNSSIESTSSTLSSQFYSQLMIAVTLAFFWMAAVVFLIFSKGWKLKASVIILNILLGIFLGRVLLGNFFIYFTLSVFLMISLVYLYTKNSIPSFAVMLSAFADIVMTVATINLIGVEVSTAGIVALLMIIGYSVDTDILLTTRVLRRKETINKELLSALKTGGVMTLTSIVAVGAALFIIYPLGSALNQIFSILLVGLGFDLLNTWFTNASIIKWYAETR